MSQGFGSSSTVLFTINLRYNVIKHLCGAILGRNYKDPVLDYTGMRKRGKGY